MVNCQVRPCGKFQESCHVFAIVVYNGEKPWSVPLNVRDCFGELANESASDKWLPSFPYCVFDMKRQPQSKLNAINNPIAWLARLEQAYAAGDTDGIKLAIQQLSDWAKNAGYDTILEDLRFFISEMVRGNGLEEKLAAAFEQAVINAEVNNMGVAETYQTLQEILINQGRQEGRQEGLQIARESIKTVLEIKFGEVGLAFWNDVFKEIDVANWGDILTAIKNKQSIAELEYYRELKYSST